MAEDKGKDNLWIGTYGGGINLLDRKTGHFTQLQHKDLDSGQPGRATR